jgi:hypothetical protein
MQTQISFGIASESYHAGVSEDGTPFYGEAYFVVAEHADGRRWSHPSYFKGVQVRRSEEGHPLFRDRRREARGLAENTLEIVREVFELSRGDMSFFARMGWTQQPCAYGSTCYSWEDEAERMDQDERSSHGCL